MVGDILCCYVSNLHIGSSSIQVKIEVWVERELDGYMLKVTEGTFTYVAVDSTRRPVLFVRKNSNKYATQTDIFYFLSLDL